MTFSNRNMMRSRTRWTYPAPWCASSLSSCSPASLELFRCLHTLDCFRQKCVHSEKPGNRFEPKSHLGALAITCEGSTPVIDANWRSCAAHWSGWRFCQTCMPTSQEPRAEEVNVEAVLVLCAELFDIFNLSGYPPIGTQV